MDMIASQETSIKSNLETLASWTIFAKAKAQPAQMEAREPSISTQKGRMRLKDARHPLLPPDSQCAPAV